MSKTDYQLVKREQVLYWTSPQLNALGYKTAFFTRRQGVSPAPMDSLNLGLHTHDRYSNVMKNRRLALNAALFGPWQPVLANQVHQNRLEKVSRKDAGKGWRSYKTAIAKTDGLLTQTPGLPIGIMTADCLPVLIVSEGKKAAAAVHAGWRGVANGILGKAIRHLTQDKTIIPKQLWVALGPAISGKQFKVRGEVLRCLKAVCPEAVVPHGRSSVSGYDLKKAAIRQFMENGIKRDHIINIPECTLSKPSYYFSFRKNNNTGRMLSLVQIGLTQK